jgi:hypothetical protein
MADSSFYIEADVYDGLVTSANDAADEAVAAFDSFDDKYLGAKSSDPLVDNDGNALVIGALYWNTVESELRAWSGSAWVAVYDRIAVIGFVIDGGGSVISPGVKGDLLVDFDCLITKATLLADVSGSIVVDIWRDNLASAPPTDADSITAAAPPTITSNTFSQDTALTGWTKSVTAGSVLRFNVDSATAIKRVTVALTVIKSLTA